MVSLIYAQLEARAAAVAAKPDHALRDPARRDPHATSRCAQSSGYYVLDNAAQRAVILTRAIPPLPACYPHSDYA